jgi:hexosaminidase
MRRWIVVALVLSVVLNAVAAVAYLTRATRPSQRPDVYRMDRIDQFRQLPTTTQPELVMLGDSLTDRGEWHELLGSGVANRGIAGETLASVVQRLDTVIALKPKTVAIMLGVNDLLAGESVDVCIARYAEVVTALQRSAPRPRIIVQGVLPVGRDIRVSADAIRLFNTKLGALCAAHSCEVIDLYPAFVASDGFMKTELTTDGVHLTGRGYTLWASLLRPRLD